MFNPKPGDTWKGRTIMSAVPTLVPGRHTRHDFDSGWMLELVPPGVRVWDPGRVRTVLVFDDGEEVSELTRFH